MVTNRRRIGFVGLGEMGLPMARRLVEAGFDVAGYDVRDDRMRELAGHGGRATTTAREAAARVEAVLLIPFHADQLRAALFGSDGVLAGLGDNGLVVAMATIGPAAMRQLGAEVSDRGFQFVDAPVTGGARGAEAGTLTVIAAGPAPALDRAQPLLEPMSATVYRVGSEPGAAQFVKLINQLLVGIHLTAAAEAMAMGAAAGVNLPQLYEILTHAAGRSEILASRVPTVLDGTLRTGGSLQIYLKDLPLALEAGRELGVPLATGSAAFQLVQMARALGAGDQDDAALIALLMDPTGAPRRGAATS